MSRLVVFAFWRTLPTWALAALAVLLVLAARASAGEPLVELDERQAAGARALARQNVWSVLLVLLPLVFLQAARLGTGAARAWLAPTPAQPLRLALLLALGSALACALATVLAAGIAEAASEARPAWRRVRAAESPRAVLFDSAPSVRWSVAAPAPGERLRLWVTVAPGAGPAASARFSARSGDETQAIEARVAGRTALELEPPGGAELELELERLGPGALLVFGSGGLEVLAPLSSERWAALALGARVWLMLSAGCVLALGLGGVLRPVLATGLVLALVLVAWARAGAWRGIPGADLPRVFAELSAGLVPAPAPLAALAGALLVAALGLALFVLAFRRAQEAP